MAAVNCINGVSARARHMFNSYTKLTNIYILNYFFFFKEVLIYFCQTNGKANSKSPLFAKTFILKNVWARIVFLQYGVPLLVIMYHTVQTFGPRPSAVWLGELSPLQLQ